MSSEETTQRRNSSGQQPGDEVSLPGAGAESHEDLSILRVLNKAPVVADEPDAALSVPKFVPESLATAAAAAAALPEGEPSKRDKAASAEEALNGGHVFDIESHLIETYDEYQQKDEAIGIKELPPIQDEITQHPSVIEVEPAGVKTIRPIETLLVSAQPSHVVADTHPASEGETLAPEKGQPEPSEEIKESARQLVDAIVLQVRETFDKIAAAEAAAEAEVEAEVATAAAAGAASTLPNGHGCPIKTDDDDAEDDEEARTSTTLSQKVDEQLSEVTSILKAGNRNQAAASKGGPLLLTVPDHTLGELKIVDVPSPKTELEIEERKRFITSLPQIGESADASQLSTECKREYYQSLKKYLIASDTERPLVPLQTYRWEDLRRAKERGGYPWTHLYKRPLGANQEPEIVLLLRKSQELRFASESPKSVKKVRIDQLVQVKETERYIKDLCSSDDEAELPQSAGESPAAEDAGENHSLRSESISCASDSVLAAGKPRKTNRLANIRRILNRRRSGRSAEDAQSLPNSSTHTSRQFDEEELRPASTSSLEAQPTATQKPAHCYPIVKKLKNMADRQKKRFNIKRIILRKNEKIVLADEPKIMKLKSSPKSDRGEIPHFIEKQDSDDILEIVELDESPSRKHRSDTSRDDDESLAAGELEAPPTSIVEPNEIIELPIVPQSADNESQAAPAGGAGAGAEAATVAEPPRKAPRLRREHVYEEIEQHDDVLEIGSVEALKQSLAQQDSSALKDVEGSHQPLPRDSSEEDQLAAVVDSAAAATTSAGSHLLAPISSIDSTSSDEDRYKTHLLPVHEESDACSSDGQAQAPRIVEDYPERVPVESAMKKEASPAPSDKKVVTFSHVEDEAEPHREDIVLPPSVLEATADANRWKNMSDHEYEPIGATAIEDEPSFHHHEPREVAKQNMDIDLIRDKHGETEQRSLHEPAAGAAGPDSRTDNEAAGGEVISSALDEEPLKEENRKRGFMASAQYQTQKLQAGLKSHAGKIKTKLRSPAKKSPQGSPVAKERKRFKAPEFSKLKMPKIKRPDVSRLKDFKRPEFTKFNKPDMSKFKLPEKFSTLKLRRSKSLKENESGARDDDETSGHTPDSAVQGETQAPKKKLEFSFGTYPRAFRKKKAPVERKPSLETATTTEGLSIIPSTDTQPSLESSSTPQGDRGPGPVRSRWADKFSDVSYNDSEGSRYRHGSEQESFYRESSLERRMKDDLEETGSDSVEMGILGGGAENKQFAEFDEENRAIHEISHLRADEFKRRPMVHQDSDLRSEDSKEAEGWTDREIQRNRLLRKAKLEAEASYLKYPSEEGMRQETQSTASSGKKVVMEEIDDDEFFLRKRGISEDNIELRQYISNAIREGYDMPINALQHVGEKSEPLQFADYDVPPAKPRRLHRSYRPDDLSQEYERDDLSMSQNGSEVFDAPKKPRRKESGRSKFSASSHEKSLRDDAASHLPRSFDDDEEYLRPPQNKFDMLDAEGGAAAAHFYGEKNVFPAEPDDLAAGPPRPQPRKPRRRKRQARDSSSMDKDFYLNGFSGRSVSSSYLQPSENVIVYRTEHEYAKPLATPETFTDGESSAAAAPPMSKPRAVGRYEEDDRTSRGAESLDLEANLQAEYEAETASTVQEKFVIDMMENDGYAVVRKEPLPKPTPPARRKKFSRSPGERFSTMPNMRTKRADSPPERPPPPRDYTASVEQPVPPRRKSTHSMDGAQNFEDDDYEEPSQVDAEQPERPERPESPRDLQSGAVINRMKFRPLPPPPRPPREKRTRSEGSRGKAGGGGGGGGDDDEDNDYDEDNENENEENNLDRATVTSSTADSYEPNDYPETEEEVDGRFAEVEVSTQTDPLPDDYFCEEFEITDTMRVIAPSRPPQTLDELLRQQLAADGDASDTPLTENEQLARGLQRFREANQRSLSERSRASSSQADHSKSLSRPQTPSAVVIERRVSTPVPSQHSETMVEAALIVRPIDDLDLEEAELRREGLLTDSSQQSKSDAESHDLVSGDDGEGSDATRRSGDAATKYGAIASEDELDAAAERLLAQGSIELEEQQGEEEMEEEKQEDAEEDEEVERSMRNYVSDEDQVDRYSSRYDEEEEEAEEEERTEHGDTDRRSEIDERELTPAIAPSPVTFTETPPQTPLEEREQQKELQSAAVAAGELNVEPAATHDYNLEAAAQEERELAALIQEAQELIRTAAEPEQSPQPPPRRKSTTALEPTLTVVAQPQATTTPDEGQVGRVEQLSQSQLPARMGELEVERLRVHALQAGQIMVSQLHGTEISSDELSCKSGNLVVNHIELPAGFIEDIVERVRHTDQAKLLTAETQTSLQASSEELPQADLIPPPKPPRHRDLEASLSRTAATASTTAPTPSSTAEAVEQRQPNRDELTQTEPTEALPLYPTAEYLQSLAPLAFYNLRRGEGAMEGEEQHRCSHHRHHHHRCHKHDSLSSSEVSDDEDRQLETRHERRERSKSSNRSHRHQQPQEKSVLEAGRQFISACSLSLVNIINQLTACIQGAVDKDQVIGARLQHIPTLVVIFIVITFALLIYLLSGRSVHTHHWDHFNPPGNEARPS